jgi:hypothetical protein
VLMRGREGTKQRNDARGSCDSFTTEVVSREKGGGKRCRGQGEGGRGSVVRTRRMEGAPDDRHDADAMESLAGQVNRGG